MATEVIATYSLVCCDLEAREWGVGVQSKFLAAASLVSWAEPDVGALATQAHANTRYGPEGLALLREGLTAQQVVERLTAADDGRAQRQVGVVDEYGGSASYTGAECLHWAGGRTGPCYAAQGNILVSERTVDALASTWESGGPQPLAERLLECLAAAQAAGGDRRGQQAAALLVVETHGGYGGLSDVVVDLRVDDHAEPIEELRRIYGLHQALFGKTPREEWITVDDDLRAEMVERLDRLGFASLEEWAGVENLEERVDSMDAVDPVVLAELRRQT
jgi:uncharacterized Ntn-hydrolase superfamily protein